MNGVADARTPANGLFRCVFAVNRRRDHARGERGDGLLSTLIPSAARLLQLDPAERHERQRHQSNRNECDS